MVVRKAKILGELAESSLLLPDLVGEALAANARIKFALSWLQSAQASVDATTRGRTADLEPERALAGLGSDPLYAPPVASGRNAQGVEVPRAAAVVSRLLEDLSRMRVAAEAGANAGVLDKSLCKQFQVREEAIRQSARLDGDVLPLGFVSMLSRPPHDERDTLHGLVMDLHKALNAIMAGLAEDDVAGARVYRLGDDDRARVRAFMQGLNRTAPLKFDHPGLATNAMRDSARLVIQNDIGTTDAHVLIAYVEGLRVSVTYSDIHSRRLDFFRSRLKEFSWTVSNRHSADVEDDVFFVATGIFQATDHAALDLALERLGASLVFLIDWNKARKSLRRLVSRSSAIAILNWAADHEVGHRGYLEVGGDAIIGDLLETASKATGGFFTSLQSAVGEDGAVEFLREALRIASEGLRAGRSAMAVRDLLRAELLARVASIADRILDIALDHAALTLDLGNLVRGALLDGHAAADKAAGRAKTWEALADRQVTRIRDLCSNGSERAWRTIASCADDAADSFEETAFRLQFLPADIPAEIRDGLLRLAEHAVAAVKEYVRLLCALRNVHRGAPRQDMRNFLDLVERLHDQEHATDEAERDVFTFLMRENIDAKALNVITAIADALEETGDALLHAGRLISDHAVGEWFAV